MKSEENADCVYHEATIKGKNTCERVMFKALSWYTIIPSSYGFIMSQ